MMNIARVVGDVLLSLWCGCCLRSEPVPAPSHAAAAAAAVSVVQVLPTLLTSTGTEGSSGWLSLTSMCITAMAQRCVCGGEGGELVCSPGRGVWGGGVGEEGRGGAGLHTWEGCTCLFRGRKEFVIGYNIMSPLCPRPFCFKMVRGSFSAGQKP